VNGECDLCGTHPQRGRLLSHTHAVEDVIHSDGRCEARSWLTEDPAVSMYWVCPQCWRLLRRDPQALLQRLLDAHGTPRN
jgi:hypothetical protein